MKKSLFTQVTRLEYYSKQLQRMVKNGKFSRLTAKKRKKWRRRIEQLQAQLFQFNKYGRIRKAIVGGTMALTLAIGMPQTAEAQTIFGNAQENPFGLTATNYIAFPAFGDLDGDGDLDVLTGSSYYGTNLFYFQNTGDSINPSFATGIANAYGLTSGYSFSMPTMVDIDGDGDLDVFVGEYYGDIQFYKNTGTPTAPSFATPVANPFGLSTGTYFSAMTFGDIDGDGDMDVFRGDYYGTIEYFQNTGDSINPAFAAPVTTPFGLAATQYYAFPTLADIDGDGDLDMFVGENYADIRYFQNTGTPTAPAFAAGVTNPFNIDLSGYNHYVAAPTFGDLDDDGDLDLLAGIYDGGKHLYLENLGANVAPTSADTILMMNQDGMYTFDGSEFPFMDANGQSFDSLRITSLPTQGALQYNAFPVSVGDVIDSLTIQLMTYAPFTGQFGTAYDSFQFEVSDGISWSSPHALTFDVNGKPTILASVIDIDKNNTHTFAMGDFAFTDPEGSALAKIQITKTVDKGLLQLNGVDVTINQEIDAADFGNLVFTPETDSLGVPYTNFEFKASDGMVYSNTTEMFTFNVNPPVGSTPELGDLAEINIFPNPVSTQLTIDFKPNQPIEDLEINVLSAVGQLVYTEQIAVLAKNVQSIDVSNWAKGVYFVRLTANEQSLIQKIIVR